MPSRRRVCAALATFPAAGLAGCLSDDGVEVGFGQIEVVNTEGRPRSGRIRLTRPSGGGPLSTPTAETVWESTFDLGADDSDDAVTPAASYVDELPEAVAPYRLHIDLENGPQKSWDLAETFSSDDDCVQARVHFDPDYPPMMYISGGGCDTVTE